jgi:hypothetical protein
MFDRLWNGNANPREFRRICYHWLAAQLRIPVRWAHFSKLTGGKLLAAIQLCSRSEPSDVEKWQAKRRRTSNSYNVASGEEKPDGYTRHKAQRARRRRRA